MTILNNEMSGWGLGETVSYESAKKMQTRIQPQFDQRKISVDGGIPQILVTDKKITLTYNDTGIAINEFGNIMKGKIHLATNPEDIRINVFWVLNPELLSCLPSTIYTPIPVLKYSDPPFAKNVTAMFKIIG